MTTDAEFRTTRPALDVLDVQQNRLLYRTDDGHDRTVPPLSEGFETYWETLLWHQRAGVRTLGHVERVLPSEAIVPESSVFPYLFNRSDADAGDARKVRQRLVESLDDACDLAYRQFRERANENADDDSREANRPEEEANPLRRPAFTKLDQEQRGSLEDLWTGFEDREQLGRWARSLSVPTHGAKPDGFVTEIIASEPLLERMLDTETETATLTRYRFAVIEILPLYLEAARTLRGSERSDRASSETTFEEA
jgi:hypothetical protein